jgi:hypothetical protein
MPITPAPAPPPPRLSAPPPPAQRAYHEHIWATAGTQPSPTRHGETIALITCQRCHEPRTITLTGTWTQDQLALPAPT